MSTPASEFIQQLIHSSDHTPRRNRLFENGHLKLLVLHLIQLAPKHGYDIIKEISDIVGGGYTPSAGTIYPTLSYLEDMQFVEVENNPNHRKKYQITHIGQQHLEQQQTQLQNVLEHLETRREIQNHQHYLDIYRAMENLKTALRMTVKKPNLSTEQVREIAAYIDHAAVEISHLE